MKRNLRALCATVVVLQACSSSPITPAPTGTVMPGIQMPAAIAGRGGAVQQQPGGGFAGSGPAAAVGGGAIGGGGAPSIPNGPGTTAEIPSVTVMAPGAGPDPDNWPGFGGGLEQTYARTNSMLDSTNLSKLGMAWDKPAPGGVTGTPAIYSGVVYWDDWVGNVHAAKLDGTAVWDQKFARGFTSSPFVDEDRVYLADRDNLVRALDRATGKELWKTSISDAKMAQLWSSPTVADGVVVVGLGGKGTSNGGVTSSSSDLMAFRGGVVGLKADTGAVIWHFENTKGKDGMMYGAGVSSWSSPALDTKRGIAYIGAGNSYYAPASPYSDSLLALNYKTTNPAGELVWSHQFTMNDNFTSGSPNGPDSDVGATPNIFTIAGKDYVAVGDKGGGFYVFDRDMNGTLLYPRIRVSAGSSTGGVMAPAAYGDGTIYVTTNNTGVTLVLAINAVDGKILWMTSEASGVSYGAPLLLKDVLLIGPTSAFPGATGGGNILAFRRDNGMKLAWSFPLKNQRGGGFSIYKSMLFLTYGFVFENDRAESTLMGGMMAAALGGMIVAPNAAPAAATYDPKYTAVYNEIFTMKGCSADRCHGGTGLMLEDPASGYTNLLQGMPTTNPTCANMKFIVPGMPMQSYLYLKLLPNPPCGSQMPLSLMPLDDKELTQVRTWIEMGAMNN